MSGRRPANNGWRRWMRVTNHYRADRLLKRDLTLQTKGGGRARERWRPTGMEGLNGYCVVICGCHRFPFAMRCRTTFLSYRGGTNSNWEGVDKNHRERERATMSFSFHFRTPASSGLSSSSLLQAISNTLLGGRVHRFSFLNKALSNLSVKRASPLSPIESVSCIINGNPSCIHCTSTILSSSRFS